LKKPAFLLEIIKLRPMCRLETGTPDGAKADDSCRNGRPAPLENRPVTRVTIGILTDAPNFVNAISETPANYTELTKLHKNAGLQEIILALLHNAIYNE